eukprot:1565501-Rhodomonas_salina.1
MHPTPSVISPYHTPIVLPYLRTHTPYALCPISLPTHPKPPALSPHNIPLPTCRPTHMPYIPPPYIPTELGYGAMSSLVLSWNMAL